MTRHLSISPLGQREFQTFFSFCFTSNHPAWCWMVSSSLLSLSSLWWRLSADWTMLRHQRPILLLLQLLRFLRDELPLRSCCSVWRPGRSRATRTTREPAEAARTAAASMAAADLPPSSTGTWSSSSSSHFCRLHLLRFSFFSDISWIFKFFQIRRGFWIGQWFFSPI